MKKIKFRAWDVLKSKMVDWETIKLMPLSVWENRYLMQFVGFEDKNNQEAFEGDLIFVGEHYEGDYTMPAAIYEICFENGEFFGTSEKDEYINLFDAFINYQAEIVGNIYENPTLRKTLKE